MTYRLRLKLSLAPSCLTLRVICGSILLISLLVPRATFAAQHDPAEIKRALLQRSPSPEAAAERQSAWAALERLDPDQRIATLKELLVQAPPDLAFLAAHNLVRERATVTPVAEISQYIADAPILYAQGIVAEVLRTNQIESLSIVPRRMLERALQEDLPYDEETAQRETFLINQSVSSLYLLHLRGRNTASDTDLLQRALTAYPQSPYAWFAAIDLGILTPRHRSLAAEMFRNESAVEHLRVLAAAALAPTDPNAATHAIRSVREVIDEFANTNLSDLIRRAYSGSEHVERLERYGRSMWIIRAVQLLPEDISRQLIEDAARAQNADIRMLAVNIAAKRWPRWLLQLEDLPLTRKQRIGMLALIGHWNPDLVEHVEELAGPDTGEVQRLLTSLEQNSFGRSDLTEDHVGVALRQSGFF